MSFISHIPKTNNIQFVPTDEVLPPAYHQAPIDKLWFSEYLKKWQYNIGYKQKIQQGDKQYLELHRQDANTVEFHIYDCNGTQVVTGFDAQFVIYDSGSVDETTGTSLAVHKWHFKFSQFGLDDGTYYIVIPVEFYDGVTLIDTKYWISEPLDIRDDHPDTVYIKGGCKTNKLDIIWKYSTAKGYGFVGDNFFSPEIGLRVEGAILDPAFKRDNVDFIEQDKQVRNLNPTPITTKRLYVGESDSSRGIPPYLMEKVNILLTCDVIYIEQRRYAIGEDAEWTVEEADQYPMYAGTIEIMDYNQQDSFRDNKGSILDIYTEPAFPYNVWDILADKDGNAYKLFSGYGWDIIDSGVRDDMIDYLNNIIADQFNQTGFYFFDDGKLQYENGDGENWIMHGRVLTNLLILDILTLSPNASFFTDVYGGTAGINWGNGVMNSVVGSPNGVTPVVYNQYSRGYVTPGAYTVRLYTDNAVLGLKFDKNNIIPPGKITDIAGQTSSNLQIFNARNHNMSGLGSGLDLSFLVNCKGTIKQIILDSCQLSGLNGNLFANNPNPSPGISINAWKLIGIFSLRNNAMSQAEISSILTDYYNFSPHNTIATIDFRQIPSVSFDSPSTVFRNNLIAQGFTVLP